MNVADDDEERAALKLYQEPPCNGCDFRSRCAASGETCAAFRAYERDNKGRWQAAERGREFLDAGIYSQSAARRKRKSVRARQ